MFIKESDAKRLFKTAYKSIGLRLIRDEVSLTITGRTWYMYIYEEYMPKEILGDVISLTGEIPDKGMQILYNEDQYQIENYKSRKKEDVYRCALEAQAEGQQLIQTDIILHPPLKGQFRLYTDANKEIYLVPEAVNKICNPALCEEMEKMQGCFADKDGWIWWLSYHMAFGISPYKIDELTPMLDRIREADIL